MMTRAIRPAVALCAALVAGCYEYLPTRDASPLAGRRVQLSLTDSGSVVLARQVGPSVDALEGTLLADSSGTYVIGMAVSRTRNGNETDWRGERVVVPRTLVASIAERRFSRSRSTFAGALMTAGIVAATVGLRGNGESSGGVPTPGHPGSQ